MVIALPTLESVYRKFESFCNATTIHGFQYMVDHSLGIFTRFLWLILITVSFTIAGILISLSFKDWQENPVLTTIDSTFYPVESIPFPAVTICSEDPDINNAERWGLVAEIFNSLIFHCHEDETDAHQYYKCSNKSVQLHQDLAPILEIATEKMFIKAMDSYKMPTIYDNFLDYFTNIFGNQWSLDEIKQLIGNLTIQSYDTSTDKLLTLIIKFLGTVPGNYYNIPISMLEYVR
jgi:hypothetical protein